MHHGQNHQHVDEHHRATDAHLNQVHRAPAGVLPELAPARAEISIPRRGIAPHSEGQQNQAAQRQRLSRCEDVLNQRTQLHAADVHESQKDHHNNPGQIRRVDADLHVAQHHRSHPKRGYMSDVPEPIVTGDGGKKHAEKLAEGHGDSGDCSRLNDQEKRPAVKKSPQRPQRFAQINVLAPGFGHHRRQLAVAERGGHGQNRRHHPRAQKKRRRVGAACNVRANNVDAGADHRSDHQRGRREQAKALHQPGSVG